MNHNISLLDGCVKILYDRKFYSSIENNEDIITRLILKFDDINSIHNISIDIDYFLKEEDFLFFFSCNIILFESMTILEFIDYLYII